MRLPSWFTPVISFNHLLFLFFSLLPFSIHGEKVGWGTMAYILQAEKLENRRENFIQRIASSDRGFIVIDRTYNGQDATSWGKQELELMRAGKEGRKIVSYFSIGEAEVYRSYWQKAWDANEDGMPDEGAPDFLLGENPAWKGNYKVKYWHKDWQAITLSILEQIIDQGFDGVYLDIVDAFEFFEYEGEEDGWNDHKLNPETQQTYRKDMIDWITRIGEMGRKRNSNFLVIPQNGSQLLEDEIYRNFVDAIGIESLYTTSARPQSKEVIEFKQNYLNKLRAIDKPIYLVEYTKQDELKLFAQEQARVNRFHLLITKKNLVEMGEAFVNE